MSVSVHACVGHRVRILCTDGEEITGRAVSAEDAADHEEVSAFDSVDVDADDGRALAIFQDEIAGITWLDDAGEE